MKFLFILFIVLVVLAGTAIGGFFLVQNFAKPKVTFYKTAQVDSGATALIATATGNVAPTSTVKVGCQVSGRVKDVKVQQDDRVKEGQILAVLDTELMENELKDKQIVERQARSNQLLLEIEEA